MINELRRINTFFHTYNTRMACPYHNGIFKVQSSLRRSSNLEKETTPCLSLVTRIFDAQTPSYARQNLARSNHRKNPFPIRTCIKPTPVIPPPLVSCRVYPADPTLAPLSNISERTYKSPFQYDLVAGGDCCQLVQYFVPISTSNQFA